MLGPLGPLGSRNHLNCTGERESRGICSSCVSVAFMLQSRWHVAVHVGSMIVCVCVAVLVSSLLGRNLQDLLWSRLFGVVTASSGV